MVPLKHFLTILLTLLFPALCIAESYLVEEGQAPWFDRKEGERVILFESIPESLRGRGPLEQQSCGSRSLIIPLGERPVLIGVEQGTDLPILREVYPTLIDTGETFSLKIAQTGQLIRYTVASLAEPPPRIEGNREGFPPLISGLIYLGEDEMEDRPTPAPSAATPDETMQFAPPAEASLLHVYLLMGQSNMLGRDPTGIQQQPKNSHVGSLSRNGEWKLAKEPLSAHGSGVGPGLSFANTMLEHLPNGVCIGLVQCAIGGSELQRWEKGGDLYARALALARSAQASGTLKGILWHQGENDIRAESAGEDYEERLARMLANFRDDLQTPDLPIVVGQLGEFVALPGTAQVRAAIAQIPQRLHRVALADSHGLADRGDRLHFSTAAQQEFGKRYAARMLALQQQR